ncbi:hypothetical protein ACWGIV_36215, partial [Streptomyces sp. NPDC054844]
PGPAPPDFGVDSDTGALGEFAAVHNVQRGDRVEARRAKAAPAVCGVASRATDDGIGRHAR